MYLKSTNPLLTSATTIPKVNWSWGRNEQAQKNAAVGEMRQDVVRHDVFSLSDDARDALARKNESPVLASEQDSQNKTAESVLAQNETQKQSRAQYPQTNEGHTNAAASQQTAVPSDSEVQNRQKNAAGVYTSMYHRDLPQKGLAPFGTGISYLV